MTKLSIVHCIQEVPPFVEGEFVLSAADIEAMLAPGADTRALLEQAVHHEKQRRARAAADLENLPF